MDAAADTTRNALAEPRHLSSASACEIIDTLDGEMLLEVASALRDVDEQLLRDERSEMRSACDELKSALREYMCHEAAAFERIRELQRAREGKGPWPEPSTLPLASSIDELRRESEVLCCSTARVVEFEAATPPRDEALASALGRLGRALRDRASLESGTLFPRAVALAPSYAPCT